MVFSRGAAPRALVLRDWLDPVSRSKIQLDFSIEKLAHLWVRMWSFRLSFPTILGTSTPGICAVVAVVVPRSKPHGVWGAGPGRGGCAPGAGVHPGPREVYRADRGLSRVPW